MLVSYSHDSDQGGGHNTDFLAEVFYRFPAKLNPQKVVEIMEMVAAKYGAPAQSQGNPTLGEVNYYWDVGGIQIEVGRGWPSTTVYLTYVLPKFKEAMDKEMATIRERQKEKELQKSSNAF